jgi:hypothetical protein
MKKSAWVIALVLLLASSGYSLSFSLKVTGGAAYVTSGDYNSGIDGINNYYAAGFSNVSSKFSKLQLGLDFHVEFMVDITRNFGLGLGVGTLQVSHAKDTVDYDWPFLSWTFHNTETQTLRVSAIPITLNAYVRVPLAGLNFRVFAGVGYYFGTMKFNRTFQSDFLLIGETVAFQANKNTFGFQGGLGLEITLGGGFSFILDISGRYARLSDIQGDYEFTPTIFGVTQPTKTGSDYYFWYYEQNAGGVTYRMVGIGQIAPSGINARHGNFDLTGVSGQAGLKVRF